MAQLPPEYLAGGASFLASGLRARRDLLPKAAFGLYRLVNQEAAFFGTSGADTVTVTRMQDGALELAFQADSGESTRRERPTPWRSIWEAGRTASISSVPAGQALSWT